MNSSGKREEIYGSKTLFREIGYYITRLELYVKSIKFFDEAIKQTPYDKRALLGRSRARARICHFVGALEDINKALALDPDDPVILEIKSLNTYLSCEFEDGLLQNSRNLPLRQKPDYFEEGVMHCTNAIENCITEIAGKPLRDHFRVIRKLAWEKNMKAHKSLEPKPRFKTKMKRSQRILTLEQKLISPALTKKLAKATRITDEDEDSYSIKESLNSHSTKKNPIPPYSQPFLFKPLQNYTSNIENYMAEKYLDSMYLDKVFLKKMLSEPGSVSPNAKGSARILKLAENGFNTVNFKQELLRTRRPFYYIKYQEATSSGALKLRQAQELQAHQQTTKKEADVLLGKMYEAFNEKKMGVLLNLVEKLKTYCDAKPKRLLMDKDVYLDEIYRLVRTGFYDRNRLNEKQYVWDQEKQISIAFGVSISSDSSWEFVTENFDNIFVNYKKSAKTFEFRLKNASSPEEMCWCYHELARNLIELKRYDLATVYARKCVHEGHNCHLEWVVNGALLLTKVNVQQRNKCDARNEILLALRIAKQLEDKKLEEYLNKCLVVVEKMEFDDTLAPMALKDRENTIVSMMVSAKMKDEVKHLFRMMSAMPSSRRMLIMPGIRNEDIEKKSRKGGGGGGGGIGGGIGGRPSILPNNVGKIQERSSSRTTICSHKSIKSQHKAAGTGVGFMDLIQYHMD